VHQTRDSAEAPTGQAPTGRPAWRARRVAAVVLALVLGVFVIALAAGNLFPAGSNGYATLSSVAWMWLGPDLVILSLVALTLAGVVLGHNGRPLSSVATVVALAAFASSSLITSIIAGATHRDGGSVSFFTALWPKVAPVAADHTETYTTADGQGISTH